MTRMTPKNPDKLCPMARTFGFKETQKTCRGPECALWRWVGPMQDWDLFKSAVKREEACLAQERETETGKPQKPGTFHKQAVSNVSKNPEGYGVDMAEREGFCGMGGNP